MSSSPSPPVPSVPGSPAPSPGGDPLAAERLQLSEDQQQASDDRPIQGRDAERDGPVDESPFTAAERDALAQDLATWKAANWLEESAPAPPAAAAAGVDAPSAGVRPVEPVPAAPSEPPVSVDGSSAVQTRPFLASWSVKEVCSWYLQIAQQLDLPLGEAKKPAAPSKHAPELLSGDLPSDAAASFVDLLQRHAIDGARLLEFAADPVLIPLVAPKLLSRIAYMRGLDTYSHMFQPLPGTEDHAHSADPNMRHLRDILASTVKIFCTSTYPDFARPWTQKDQTASTSSGFVISGRRIIGNAHGATSATNIRIRKHGDATKYKATVQVISHEADLVILEVASEKFWKGLEPLHFGHVPRLQDTVIVVGYPTGGDSICVTKGVVSRVLVSNYTHSDESLLTVQIDAAINPGNSGGPVLLNGAVVGVAFQGNASAQNVGYIIPSIVVLHFLTDLQLHGRYTGFPSLAGLQFQRLENESLKKYYGLSDDQTGIVMMDVAPLDGARAVLQANDVVTHIDGISIADDETIFFRHGERISCRYLASSKFVGDVIKLRIVRAKRPMEVAYQLQARRNLVPAHLYDTHPSYFILGGLVFTPLTRPYLRDCFGKNWYKQSSVELIDRAYMGSLEHADQQCLVLSSIMVDDLNTGYGSGFHNIILQTINGRAPRNLHELVDLCEEEQAAGVDFLRFDFTQSRVIVVETKLIAEATARVLAEKKIEHDRSSDLRQAKAKSRLPEKTNTPTPPPANGQPQEKMAAPSASAEKSPVQPAAE